MQLFTAIVSIALIGSTEAAHSKETTKANIQPLGLTNFRGEEAECLNMTAYSLNYCLYPPDTPANTSFLCYIDEELVFECNIQGTDCKGHSLLKGMVKRQEFKSKTCHFLEFFKVSQDILNRHYICCTPNGTFHRYLQNCTDESSAPPLPPKFQQLCGHWMESTTEAVHDMPSTEALNTTTVLVVYTLIPSLLLVLPVLTILLWKFYRSREPQNENNNQQILEEGTRMTPTKEGIYKQGADQHTDNPETDPLSPKSLHQTT